MLARLQGFKSLSLNPFDLIFSSSQLAKYFQVKWPQNSVKSILSQALANKQPNKNQKVNRISNKLFEKQKELSNVYHFCCLVLWLCSR